MKLFSKPTQSPTYAAFAAAPPTLSPQQTLRQTSLRFSAFWADARKWLCWQRFALSGLLGLRLGPSGGRGLYKWRGEALAFSYLILNKIGFVLTELC